MESQADKGTGTFTICRSRNAAGWLGLSLRSPGRGIEDSATATRRSGDSQVRRTDRIAPLGRFRMLDSNRSSTIPTLSLFAYLLTVMAWEFEIGVLLLHIFANKKLDPLGHVALLGVSLSLTTFAWLRGKRDFQRLRWTRGRVPITRVQGLLITVFMVCFGGFFGWIVMRLVEH